MAGLHARSLFHALRRQLCHLPSNRQRPARRHWERQLEVGIRNVRHHHPRLCCPDLVRPLLGRLSSQEGW